ncbi:hypothetical protein WA158_004344 [Blastocystis sp. Blastoise]
MPYSRRNLKNKKPMIIKKKQKSGLKLKTKVGGGKQIKKIWNQKKSARQNYAKLGLILDANHPETSKKVSVPLYEIPSLEEAGPKRGKNWMTRDDRKYIKALIDKYDTDYTKMFRDIKLNYKQLTATKLENMHNKYNLCIVEEKEYWDRIHTKVAEDRANRLAKKQMKLSESSENKKEEDDDVDDDDDDEMDLGSMDDMDDDIDDDDDEELLDDE